MNFKLIVVGKTDQSSLQELITQYQKRLSHYCKFNLVVIPDLKNTKKLSETQQKQQEGKLIESHISNSTYVVLLDEKGKQYTSENFALQIQKIMNQGRKELVFVIGGPYGFSEAVYQRADQKVSLSLMTFSHQMVRLFFIEQLYRAFTILNNEPYHHR